MEINTCILWGVFYLIGILGETIDQERLFKKYALSPISLLLPDPQKVEQLFLTGDAPIEVHIPSISVYDNETKIIYPRINKNGYPLLMYHHGMGESPNAIEFDTQKKEIFKIALENGFIIASCFAQGNNFGCEKALDDYYNLYNLICSNNIISKVVVLSQSMGGLSGLLSVLQNRIPIVGWAGIYPICNLIAIYNDSRFTGFIDLAYEGTLNAFNIATFDPVSRSAEFTNIRMRYYASYHDTIVPRGMHADRLFFATNNLIENEIVDCFGEHGNQSHFQSDDLNDFLLRCIN